MNEQEQVSPAESESPVTAAPVAATPVASKPKRAAAKKPAKAPLAAPVAAVEVVVEAAAEAVAVPAGDSVEPAQAAVELARVAPVTRKAAKSGKPAKAAKAPKVSKEVKEVKEAKPAKPKKSRLVRDSYAMPEAEYLKIGELKKRAAQVGVEIKKSELLRCGIALLDALNEHELKAVLGRVERIKTGRPSKK